MRIWLVVLAASVLLGANLGAVVSAWRNRNHAAGGTVELTERELHLPPLIGDSTALLLDLHWEMAGADRPGNEGAGWLTVPKLQELGFDCTLPTTNAHARAHYSAMGLVPVQVVLEYEGEAWRRVDPQRKVRSHLFAIDAGQDPRRLREKYADPARFILARGLVRLVFETHDRPGGEALAEPRLRGRIVELLPSTVFVPPPYCETLQKLRRPLTTDRPEADPAPRFALTLSWGTRQEPWVSGVRLLP